MSLGSRKKEVGVADDIDIPNKFWLIYVNVNAAVLPQLIGNLVPQFQGIPLITFFRDISYTAAKQIGNNEENCILSPVKIVNYEISFILAAYVLCL